VNRVGESPGREQILAVRAEHDRANSVEVEALIQQIGWH